MSVGVLVVVPFRKSKLMTGIVVAIHETPPTGYSARYIDTLLDSKPIIHEVQLRFWSWMSTYYMCHMGEILLAALPAGIRLSSETSYQLNPAFDGDISSFTTKESLLLEALSAREVMAPDEISELLQVKAYQPTIKKLLAAGAILVMEDLKERYKPRYETFVKLSPACEDEDGLQSAFKLLERAPKQQEVLMMYVQLSRRYTGEVEEVKKTILQKFAGCTASVVAELLRKGVLEIYERETSRLPNSNEEGNTAFELSAAQQIAFGEIHDAFRKKSVTLLHGITSSGKTEIYVKLVSEMLEKGKQVLYMLPEIALTTQMIVRLQRYFGNQVLVYHSRFNQNERVEVWNMVLKNNSPRGRLILGARSAMFLPFSDLGLVIVDEEHEVSFKQHDPAPRYHARDAAIVLASLHKAPVLLGSATPAFETMQNARQDKYGYVQLTERYGGMDLPEVKPLLLSKSTAPSGYFTETLLASIKETLARKEQVILFQNRRGYAPILVCTSCGWTPECTRCDVSATFHKALNRLLCHYCGNRYTIPPECPKCGSHKLKLAGFGTERIEEELEVFFPEAKIARLDLDSTRTKMAYQQILGDFQDGAIDVLIGTQMVTKGLDFGRVSLVGVLNADLLLKFPDFRSVERAYQLMTQVAGRAGRRKKKGEVLIQSQNPGHWVITAVQNAGYEEVFGREMEERSKFKYPPFSRLILLIFRHSQMELTDYCAATYATELLALLPKEAVLGPEYPQVARVKNRYNKHLLIKIDPHVQLSNLKAALVALNHRFFARKEFRQVRLIINVDPQ